MALLEDIPARLRAPLQQLASLAAISLWIAPTAAAVVAIVLASALVAWDPTMAWLPLRLEDPAAARAGLGAVLTATVAAVSLVGTGTIVALQLATGQYSPRLLRGVLRDSGIRWSLAGLVGVVVYTLLVLTQIEGARPPRAAIALGLLSGIAAVGLLILFVHQVAARVRLETILETVTEEALAAVVATYPEDAEEPDEDVPDDATRLPARRSGYVQAVSLEAVADAAAALGVHVRLRLPVGEFLVRGTTSAWAWPVDEDDALDDESVASLADDVNGALALGVDRTTSGDPAYGLRHLVDVGLRGVSPSTNDPTTTIQCVHQATRVLISLAERPLCSGMVVREGSRVVLPRPDLADHLDLAQSQLLQYGGHDARVVEALAQQLRDIAETMHPASSLLRDHLDRLRTDADGRDHRPHEREVIDAALDRLESTLAGLADDEEEPSAG